MTIVSRRPGIDQWAKEHAAFIADLKALGKTELAGIMAAVDAYTDYNRSQKPEPRIIDRDGNTIRVDFNAQR